MEAPTFQKQHKAYFCYGKNTLTGRRFTIAAVTRKGNTYIAVAECSNNDQFSRKLGRKVAESRAVHNPMHVYEGEDRTAAINIMLVQRELLQPQVESKGPEIGDFVPMVHMIEKLRQNEHGQITMNELISAVTDEFDFTIVKKK